VLAVKADVDSGSTDVLDLLEVGILDCGNGGDLDLIIVCTFSPSKQLWGLGPVQSVGLVVETSAYHVSIPEDLHTI